MRDPRRGFCPTVPALIAIAVFGVSQFGPARAHAADVAASVSCKDGTTSPGGRGACSHHGGIADAAPNGKSGPASTAPAQADAGASAGIMCKDGSRSAKSGRGACSHHGGMATAGAAGAPGSARAPDQHHDAPAR